jgi:hypothetical protein
VRFEHSPFPYRGEVPEKNRPFLDAIEGERRGHVSPRGGIYWEELTYSDRRSLLHIPKGFDPRRPALIVVFFHGNEAKLVRDVRNRQEVPRQVDDPGSTPCSLRRSSLWMRSIQVPAGSGSAACSRNISPKPPGA